MFARFPAIVLSLFVAAATVVAVATAARADQQYTVDGRDTFRITGSTGGSDIAYAGTGRLRSVRVGSATRFTTTVEYDRTRDGTTTRATGSFETTLLPGGAQRDGTDADPDYLTILNQPFAVQLDLATLRDLRALAGAIPFDFPSPMIGATLHGALRRLPDGLLQGERVLGVAFTANGPLRGALPDRPGLSVTGTISMSGRAYYALATALLLGLDATLAIDGNLDASAAHEAVSIVYKRTIRPLRSPLVAKRASRETGTSIPKPRNSRSDERG